MLKNKSLYLVTGLKIGSCWWNSSLMKMVRLLITLTQLNIPVTPKKKNTFFLCYPLCAYNVAPGPYSYTLCWATISGSIGQLCWENNFWSIPRTATDRIRNLLHVNNVCASDVVTYWNSNFLYIDWEEKKCSLPNHFLLGYKTIIHFKKSFEILHGCYSAKSFLALLKKMQFRPRDCFLFILVIWAHSRAVEEPQFVY